MQRAMLRPKQRPRSHDPAAYYNEIDPYLCGWLRNLIAADLILPGDVDDRDIRSVRADDLRGYGQCHFFAGIGGFAYACRLAGWPDDEPVWTLASPASRSALQAASARKRTTATSGRNCAALLHRRAPLYSWPRTLLASSRWASTEFLLTWRLKATPAGRLLFQLAPSTPRTDATGFGSSVAVWPTATANDPEKRGDFAAERRNGLPGVAKAVWSTLGRATARRAGRINSSAVGRPDR
ncbi:putative methyl transferase protein [Lysobacter antibioticus]|uniref:Putative methyl transferase protein n=1 Tax=Lysobacter antibioticus TaxID=84531 RepID=A0A0S2FHL4_LYSAN|nr:putative methyl transferase protein [Lysobacter antibioticus]